jgi:hypothetical protein
MSDTPEVFDLSSVRLGVWMGGSEEGNAGHGLYSEVAPGLFDLILLGRQDFSSG